eukprot:4967040-Amphidinium_carterae.1
MPHNWRCVHRPGRRRKQPTRAISMKSQKKKKHAKESYTKESNPSSKLPPILAQHVAVALLRICSRAVYPFISADVPTSLFYAQTWDD